MTTGLVATVPKFNSLRTVPPQIHGLSCTSLTGAKIALTEIRIHFVLTTSSVKTPQSNSCSFRTLHHLHELTEQKPFRARRSHVASSTLRTSLPDRIRTLRPLSWSSSRSPWIMSQCGALFWTCLPRSGIRSINCLSSALIPFASTTHIALPKIVATLSHGTKPSPHLFLGSVESYSKKHRRLYMRKIVSTLKDSSMHKFSS